MISSWACSCSPATESRTCCAVCSAFETISVARRSASSTSRTASACASSTRLRARREQFLALLAGPLALLVGLLARRTEGLLGLAAAPGGLLLRGGQRLGTLGRQPLGRGLRLRPYPVRALLRLRLQPLGLGRGLGTQSYGDVLALGAGRGRVRRGLVAQPLGLRLGLRLERTDPLGGLRAQPLRLLGGLAADAARPPPARR